MNDIEIGKIYTNGNKTREIIGIDGGEIHYRTEKGIEKHCWITTFQDWILKGKRINAKRCKWKFEGELYETGCDKTFQVMEGNIRDNGIKFCPFCGKEIEEIK